MTVKVDHTQNLRGRERVGISWTGAQPSGGRAPRPVRRERHEPGVPGRRPAVPRHRCKRASRPETCWTSSVGAAVAGRPLRGRGRVDARTSTRTPPTRTRHQRHVAVAVARRVPAASTTPACYATHLTPFVSAKGKVYPACDVDNMPPEAGVGRRVPARRDRRLHRRRRQRLGPVRGAHRRRERVARLQRQDRVLDRRHPDRRHQLRPGVGTRRQPDAAPSRRAARPAGSLRGRATSLGDGVDQAVSPALWWSASNWRNRFVDPDHLRPAAGRVRHPRPARADRLLRLGAARPGGAPVGAGVLPEQEALQVPAQPDVRRGRLEPDGGRRRGGRRGVRPSTTARRRPGRLRADRGDRLLASATSIDKPDNAGEFTRAPAQRPPARQAAHASPTPGPTSVPRHPGMADNPWRHQGRPRVHEAQPRAEPDRRQEAGAALLSLVELLRHHRAADGLHRARTRTRWRSSHGKPDPWGMKVNPAYKDLNLPHRAVAAARQLHPDDRRASAARRTRRSTSTTSRPRSRRCARSPRRCSTRGRTSRPGATPTSAPRRRPTSSGRVDRQRYGTRFMLGIVSLGDAARYGLRTAALETKPGHVRRARRPLARPLR